MKDGIVYETQVTDGEILPFFCRLEIRFHRV